MAALVIHQPAYLPWMGYFARLLLAKEFVILDHVQFTDGGWQNRNYILGTSQGSRCRLTLPVHKRGRFRQAISDVALADRCATRRHWQTISTRYRKAPYFQHYATGLQRILDREWSNMASLCDVMIAFLMSCLDIYLPVVRSSSLGLVSTRTQLLVDLCEMRRCSVLLTGSGAAQYLDVCLLADRGIVHQPDGFRHPTYQQIHSGFVSHLSVVDLLFSCGPKAHDLLVTSVAPIPC